MAKKPVKAAPKAKAQAKPAAKLLSDKQASLRVDFPREFDLGRRAARSGIMPDQAPALNGDAKKAWLEGHKSVHG